MENVSTSSASIAISGLQEITCQACDPASENEHVVQITRLRVANLCCAGEEKIIRSTLKKMVGIEHIAVNIVGRYAVIKHCSMTCCAPTEEIIKQLNEKHLGVSLQEVGTAEGSTDSELPQFLIALAHVSTVFGLFIAGLVVHLTDSSSSDISMWIYLASILVGIAPLLYGAYIALFVRRVLDIHVLMLIAIVGATASGETFDASLVVSLFLIAELFESVVMQRVRKAVDSSSAGAIPRTASLANGRTVDLDEVKAGDVLAIRTGDMILTDGVVLVGEAVVDESSLTGESVPVTKSVADRVSSGTVVQNGYIEVKAENSARESTLFLLRQAVLDVQADRGRFARVVDQFAQYWTPFVITAAALLVSLRGGISGDWGAAIQGGLLLLVLACPCAIVVAAPIPAVCAIATASRNGVLIRGSSVVEQLGSVDTLAVDKTGTLTKGFFTVSKLLRFVDGKLSDINTNTNTNTVAHGADKGKKEVKYMDREEEEEDDPLRLAAAIEQKSTHPLASAIVAAHFGCIAESEETADNNNNSSGNNGTALPEVRKVAVVEGVGVTGWVQVEDDWKFVAIGNERIFRQNGGSVVLSREEQSAVDQLMNTDAFNTAATAVVETSDEVSSVTSPAAKCDGVRLFVAVEDELKLMIELSDEVRPESRQFVAAVKQLGFNVSMLTGDAEGVAKAVCKQVGIDDNHCHYRLLPVQKLNWIQLQQHQPLTRTVVRPVEVVDDDKAAAAVAAAISSDDITTDAKAEADANISAAGSVAMSVEVNDPDAQYVMINSDEVVTEIGLKRTENSMSPQTWEGGEEAIMNKKICCPAFLSFQSQRGNGPSDATELSQQLLEAASSVRRNVLMIGDGINDSTALAAATIGVAMGAGGSAMAVAAADVVLISDNLMLLPAAIDLCRRARWAMVQNCVLAIAIKIIAIILAILGYLQFWHAILIDIGSLLIVVINGTKILRPSNSNAYSIDSRGN